MPDNVGVDPAGPDRGARPSRRRVLLVLFVVTAVIVAAMPIYFFATSPEWDGGRWGPDTLLSFGAKEFWIPVVIEYQGLAYAFSPIVSRGNITPTGFDDGTGFDVVMRTFDGTVFGPAEYVSNLVDNRSEFVSGAAVFESRLFIARSVMTDPPPDAAPAGPAFESRTGSIELASFDGASWTEHPPIRGAEPAPTRFEAVELVVSNGSLWAFWQEAADGQNGTFRARAFSDGVWGPALLVNAPTPAVVDARFLAAGETIWVTWFNNATAPSALRGVHFGRLKGSALEEVGQVSDGTGESFPHARLVLFRSAVMIVWSRADGIHSRSFDGEIIWGAIRVTEGNWGAPVVYKDKLYVVSVRFGSFPPTWQWGVASFDGTRWSPWYAFGTARSAFEYPAPFVLGGKIFVHWIDGTGGNFAVHLRSYER